LQLNQRRFCRLSGNDELRHEDAVDDPEAIASMVDMWVNFENRRWKLSKFEAYLGTNHILKNQTLNQHSKLQ